MSAPASTNATQNAAPTQSAGASAASTLEPSAQSLVQAAKIALEKDCPIMLDYYRQTAGGTAFLGEDPDSKERVLVKSKDEFTSLIKKLYKVGDDFIILTENSLYVVSGKIQKRKVNVASLQEAYDSL
jgi:hypothetical protein